MKGTRFMVMDVRIKIKVLYFKWTGKYHFYKMKHKLNP